MFDACRSPWILVFSLKVQGSVKSEKISRQVVLTLLRRRGFEVMAVETELLSSAQPEQPEKTAIGFTRLEGLQGRF